LINETNIVSVDDDEKIEIIGGSPLEGSVNISGAKNAVLKLMAASLLVNNKAIIRNVPRIRDVEIMIKVIKALGVEAEWENESTLVIRNTNDLGYAAPDELVREIRASAQVMGPLLTKVGQAKLFQPGGDVIGHRPINLHLKGFQALGAELIEEHGYVYLKADKLRGTEIHLDFPSVGATENIMAAAIMAEGTTVIRNAAREPEIIEEQNFYNRLGAKIRGTGTDTIRIEGVTELNNKEIDYTVIPDRIEAGTFMIAGAITAGDVTVTEMIPEHLEALIAKLHEIGVVVEVAADKVRVKAGKGLNSVDVTVLPYPGFPTDLQPQITALLSIASGTSVIAENVYSSRFRYVDELIRMGANISVESRSAIVRGIANLSGAKVLASDIRAAAALVIAGLAADGITTIEGLTHLNRGYEKVEKKLTALGAKLRRF
jgi:UDP-N-acetylglucosamine 1-carboxyvinyltransferase